MRKDADYIASTLTLLLPTGGTYKNTPPLSCRLGKIPDGPHCSDADKYNALMSTTVASSTLDGTEGEAFQILGCPFIAAVTPVI